MYYIISDLIKNKRIYRVEDSINVFNLIENDYIYDNDYIIEVALINNLQIFTNRFYIIDELILAKTYKLFDIDTFKYLINNGANIHNKKIIKIACDKGNLPIVELLINHGANITVDNNYCLMTVVHFGYVEIFKLLINFGADIAAQNNRCIRIAIDNGYYEMVKVLIDLGADIHATNSNNVDSIQLACCNNNLSVIKLLINNGANILANNNNCIRLACTYTYTYTCAYDNIELVKLLIDLGADIHANNNEAIKIAFRHKNKSLIKLLIVHGADF